MASTVIATDSLLALDIGSVNTRAMLFDVVEGQYRFLAMGIAPTTAAHPYRDIGTGIHAALDQLQEITGRSLFGEDGRLMIPSTSNGTGVDVCVATISAGGALKTVAVGLLEDVSTESAVHLASTTYAQVMDVFSLNDRRKDAARLDAILRLKPDLIIVAGGTDGGASHSVMGVLEAIGLACQLTPESQRPEVLFAGNQMLVDQVKTLMPSAALFHVSPNIRPTLETEQLEPAQVALSQIYRLARIRKVPGAQELDLWTGGRLLPTATAFGRLIRYINRIHPARGLLGVDLGASSTMVAAAYEGDSSLGVYPYLGVGESLAGLLHHTTLDEICGWLSLDVPAEDVRDYLYNKAIHPQSLPITPEDLAIEHAIARQILALALRKASPAFPEKLGRSAFGLSNKFGVVIGSGSVITHAPARSQSLLMLLDALQPVGYLMIALDQNNLAAALGAAASVTPVVTVHGIDNAFVNLGTVISPIGNADRPVTALRVRAVYQNGHTVEVEVKYGSLEFIPLPMNQVATLHLYPQGRFDIGKGPGVSGKVENVVGGYFGIVVDARGRPLKLPADAGRRADLYRKWFATLEQR